MGTAVIGGLLVATLITLFITPTFYVAAERLLGRKIENRREAGRERQAGRLGRLDEKVRHASPGRASAPRYESEAAAIPDR